MELAPESKELLPLHKEERPLPARSQSQDRHPTLLRTLIGAIIFCALCARWQILPISEIVQRFRSDEVGSVEWQPCEVNSSYSCTWLKTPKDYFNKSAGFVEIAVLKVPATAPKAEQLGGIFLNPGGPGGSGVTFAAGFGSRLSELTNGTYSFYGFDPRGIGQTRPRVECFASTLEHELFKAGSVLERGFDISKDPFSYEGTQHLLYQHRQLMGLQETQFKKCAEVMGDELKYMSTSTVVRDIDWMSQHFEGKDTPINFWGFSYGTILGAYLVNMIPDRIGKVIIDGVASAPQWANERTYTWLKDWMVYTETTYNWFLRDCSMAGPEACPLAKMKDEKPHEIAERLDQYLDNLYESPEPIPDAFRPGILNSGGARALLYSSTNQPAGWPAYAQVFADALAGNATSLYNLLAPKFHANPALHSQGDLSRAAVSCSDTPPFKSKEDWPTAEKMVNETLRVLRQTSPRFGASVSLIEPDGGCQFHPSSGHTPERFTGPWNATLKIPMLIVSNTADPITPLTSGRELNHLMGNSSRLLIQNSPGHCSIGSVSVCTLGLIRKYWLDGELPDDETLCQVDRGYFPVSDTLEVKAGDEGELLGLGDNLLKAWKEYTLPSGF